ncbi:hypothetical protein ACS5PN_13240 [Roseateles sp. NT4]|uniref:hypothetical protein n=1 Tax=Roseateles sp. NT4 TaxID=3453715 RepID=UPI003EEFB057
MALPSAGEIGFAHLVSALQVPEPIAVPTEVTRRRPKASRVPAVASAEESTGDMLSRAERCARGGRIEEALSLCQTLKPRLVAAGDLLSQGICEHMVALSQQYAGRMKESTLAGYRAMDLLSRAQAPGRLLRVLGLQAIGMARMGDVAESLGLLGRALRLLPEVNDLPGEQCILWNNAGAAYHALGRLPEAVDAAVRAIGLLHAFDEPNLRAVCHGNLLIYRLERELARDASLHNDELLQALDGIRAHIEALIADERHHFVPESVNAAADAMFALGRMDEAREWLWRGVKSARTTGAGPELGLLEWRLAYVDRLAGQYRAAASHIALALELLGEGQSPEPLARVHLENCLLQEAQQHWRAALDSHKRYAEIRETLLKSQADARTQALSARLEVEREHAEAAMQALAARTAP